MEDLTFKEFLLLSEYSAPENYRFSDAEVANLYHSHRDVPVRELARITGRSIGELYRNVGKYGNSNRTKTNRHLVVDLLQTGMHPLQVAEITKYSPRMVWNIKRQIR